MNATHVAAITELLLRRTVANGCTEGEAAEAAARVARYVKDYGVGILPKSQVPPPAATPAPPPFSTPTEAEYAAWRAQFGTTPYRYDSSNNKRRRWINCGPWFGLLVCAWWIFVLVALVFGY